MASEAEKSVPQSCADAIARVGPAVREVFEGIEHGARHMAPANMESLRAALAPAAARLQIADAVLRASPVPDELRTFGDRVARGTDHAQRAARLFLGEEPHAGGGVAAILESLREHCLAQAAVYPVRAVLPRLDAWFIEPGFAWRLPALHDALAHEEPVGLFDASNERDRRGGFTLFVPEDYEGAREWPLVVALHGGFGHGADFLWTWLREARARGWLLLAPTSRGPTWSLQGSDVDGQAIEAMLDYVRGRWRVDPRRVLLTGLSDGATYALLHGLRDGSSFSHLAPIAGVLHPANFVNGNLTRARGRRIRMIHGAQDWMFPVSLAREAARVLEVAGADLSYDELPDLAHAHPREQNGPILAWATETASAGLNAAS